ncbi:Chorismate synthase, chloroplast precursor [Dorcoceras hygrometricum]|uniref:chorismate synthase n=1 Tax=Dorcoceras hygrometricum TaxID=472368 RepID=A0A2Z7CR65_9LAMI|nr:Chorismate synthase, chloroplast precursor [Dorcoceras hygrometricum]
MEIQDAWSVGETILKVTDESILAKCFLKVFYGTEISTYASQVYEVVIPDDFDHHELTHDQIHGNVARSSNPEHLEKTNSAIDTIRVSSEPAGGVVTCIVRKVPRNSIPAGTQFGPVRVNQSASLQDGTLMLIYQCTPSWYNSSVTPNSSLFPPLYRTINQLHPCWSDYE